MKTVLCFGDSNTWGYIPGSGNRYPQDVRWTGILQKYMGEGARVIENGLNGRTTVWEDPIEGDKCGLYHLAAVLDTHPSLDIIVLMLGTNDLKYRFSLTPFDIAAGAGRLVQTIQENNTSHETQRILLVCPPIIGPLEGDLSMMYQDGIEKSHQLPTFYSRVADTLNCDYLCAADFVKPSQLDGIHLDQEGHKTLSAVLAERVTGLLQRCR